MTREQITAEQDRRALITLAVAIVLFAGVVTYSCGFQEGARVADEAHSRRAREAQAWVAR